MMTMAQTAPREVAGAAPGAPILIIDDEPQIRQLLLWALEDLGQPMVTAGDEPAAVACLQAQQPALVLLDLTLKVGDGSGVAAALHARYGRAVPIIVMTADEQAAEKAQRLGAAAYFRKPFDLDALLGTVTHLLAHSA